MHPDDYRINIDAGDHGDYIPAYVGEFAIAEKLRIPVHELPEMPVGLVHAARVVLEAEYHRDRMTQEKNANR